jgi:hypothetical protein
LFFLKKKFKKEEEKKIDGFWLPGVIWLPWRRVKIYQKKFRWFAWGGLAWVAEPPP